MITLIILFYIQEEIPTKKWAEISSRNPTITETKDGQSILDLFEAYENGKPEILKNVQESGHLKFLDNEVLKLLRTMPALKATNTASDIHETLQDEIEEEGYC